MAYFSGVGHGKAFLAVVEDQTFANGVNIAGFELIFCIRIDICRVRVGRIKRIITVRNFPSVSKAVFVCISVFRISAVLELLPVC
jgi:hypothetical protein